ncbi:MAG: hypothetical protein AB1432_05670 [Bacteroidota bacterium]
METINQQTKKDYRRTQINFTQEELNLLKDEVYELFPNGQKSIANILRIKNPQNLTAAFNRRNMKLALRIRELVNTYKARKEQNAVEKVTEAV